jgi:hypothetical protein
MLVHRKRFERHNLVGGFNHLETYQSQWVKGKDYPIYEMEIKKCLKPPTRRGNVGKTIICHPPTIKKHEIVGQWEGLLLDLPH